jgi:hypothetical protein
MNSAAREATARLADRSRTSASAGRGFYFAFALLIALVVVAGFGRTVGPRLFHPASPIPRILFLHGALFSTWILLLIVQTGLVATRRIVWHRRLGAAAVVLGLLIPVVGVMTTLAMVRLHIEQGVNGTDAEAFLISPLFDMLAFTVFFALAIYWRRRPEFHRRLMIMATCGLTAAAFSRFPNWLVPKDAWYVAVDLLILVGVMRDLYVMRRVHPVYLYGLPALVLAQATVYWIYLHHVPAWVAAAHWILS